MINLFGTQCCVVSSDANALLFLFFFASYGLGCGDRIDVCCTAVYYKNVNNLRLQIIPETSKVESDSCGGGGGVIHVDVSLEFELTINPTSMISGTAGRKMRNISGDSTTLSSFPNLYRSSISRP